MSHECSATQRHGYKTLLSILLLLVSGPALFAQGFATLNGTVKDPSGAVVPSATITAIQVTTGTTSVAKTNNAGLFVFPSLPPSAYSLSVSAPGFQTYVQKGVILQANESATANISLKLGSSTQTVEVTGGASAINLTTNTVSQVISRRRINDLPLNGRNAAALTTLVAGVVVAPSDGADQGHTKTFPVAVTISANGSRAAQTSFLLDGDNNMDEYTNVNDPFPFPDALQEFSVQTSNYSAQFGGNSGAVVNIVTKSGGSSFHGDIFEYLRNGALNARNYFASSVDPLHRNQFGGTIGGPVIIPHLINGKHTFFFFGYQKTILHDDVGGKSAFVPTQANLQGDFSSVLNADDPDNPLGKATKVLDPETGLQFPNNQIPLSRLDPSALAFSKDLPSVTGNGQVFFRDPLEQNFNEYLIRIDQDISSKDHLFGHFYYDKFSQAGELDPSNLLTASSHADIPFRSTLVSETHIFNPNMVNDLIIGYVNEIAGRGPVAQNHPSIVKDFGVNMYLPAGIPALTIAANGFFKISEDETATFQRNNYTLTDDFHWVKGNHNLTFGGEVELTKEDTDNQFKQFGQFTFASTKTNDADASFLLGFMQNFVQGSGQFLNARNHFFAIYAQDSWKVSRRFTFNYGLRYEPFYPWREIHHRITQFSPSAFAAGRTSALFLNAPPGLLFSGDAGVPVSGVRPYYGNVAPRLGFAWDVFGNGKTSLRGGGGLFYDSREPAYILNSMGSSVTPFSVQVSLTQPQGPFSDPYRGITNPFPIPPTELKNTIFPPPVNVETYDPSGAYHVPVTYNWNLLLQQQLTKDLTFQVGYIGSHSSHVFMSNSLNPSTYIPGSKLSPTERAHYPGYAGISEVNMGGNGNYNSLQATLDQRFSHGLTVLLNYTFSKALDDLPFGTQAASGHNGQDSYVFPVYSADYKRLDRGPSDFDHRNVVSASYIYEFPHLHSGPRVFRWLLSNWQQAGIVQAMSGGPLTVLAGQDRSQTNLGQDRAEIVKSHGMYGPGACKSGKSCVNYLDPSAFDLPAIGQFGDFQKGALTGPGYFDWDASLMRNIKIYEGVNLQFRAEYFNLPNRANFGDPTTKVSSGGFGSITSASDPRIGQLALKVIF